MNKFFFILAAFVIFSFKRDSIKTNFIYHEYFNSFEEKSDKTYKAKVNFENSSATISLFDSLNVFVEKQVISRFQDNSLLIKNKMVKDLFIKSLDTSNLNIESKNHSGERIIKKHKLQTYRMDFKFKNDSINRYIIECEHIDNIVRMYAIHKYIENSNNILVKQWNYVLYCSPIRKKAKK